MNNLNKILQKVWRLPSITGLARRKITAQFLEEIRRNANKKLAILDIGSGINNWSSAFPDAGLEIYHTVELDDKLEATFYGDFLELHFNRTYDLVIATEFIEHISDPRKFFEKAHSALRADGRLLISFPFMFKMHGNPDDFYRYTESGVKAVSDSFFDIESIHAHGGKFQTAWEILVDGKVLYPLRLLNPLIATTRSSNTDFALGYVAVLRPKLPNKVDE